MTKYGRSAEAAIWHKWYSLAIWRSPKHGLRLGQLRKQPLCEFCLARGDVTPANTVDHRLAHKGDWELFTDPDNLQSLCEPHHTRTKAEIESRGYHSECGLDGMPLDPGHPSNRPRPGSQRKGVHRDPTGAPQEPQDGL